MSLQGIMVKAKRRGGELIKEEIGALRSNPQ